MQQVPGNTIRPMKSIILKSKQVAGTILRFADRSADLDPTNDLGHDISHAYLTSTREHHTTNEKYNLKIESYCMNHFMIWL